MKYNPSLPHPALKITVISLILLLVLIATEQVVWGIGWTVSQPNFLSGVTAKGKVEVFPVPEANTTKWDCRIRSYTSPTTTINIIGWTWWQCDSLAANGSIIQSYLRPARAVTASSTEELFHFPNPAWGTPAKFKASGVHDFNHPGSNPSPWRPYNAVICSGCTS